ncbi:hypothetical protein AXF42_Ash018034 [Apostasia shenzhenica]|uniref:Uncharacterized protein n=1 Tax=Apostasia shenzhenica TaxID=1088818 RepID=A0A2I0AVK0_9ASPA|nr:hypothetical protein AXF42_Ash018034 [Apostasia shenzhenica]
MIDVGGISHQPSSSMPLIFCHEGLSRQDNPHNDPIVVTTRVVDFDVRWVLLDSGSATDILFESAFLQMGLKEMNLLRTKTTLLGFSGERVQPLGFISLSVSFCDGNGHVISMVNFAVIRAKSGYNVILGRTPLNFFGMVISTPHLCTKFPTSSGVVIIRGDLQQATRCFQISAQLIIDQLDPRESQVVLPQEGVINVLVGGEGSFKIVNISFSMNANQQADVTALLSEYIDVFAWSPEDISEVDRATCEHHLNISADATPIKQKKRVMAGERQSAVEEEVNKLLKAGYIRKV